MSSFKEIIKEYVKQGAFSLVNTLFVVIFAFISSWFAVKPITEYFNLASRSSEAFVLFVLFVLFVIVLLFLKGYFSSPLDFKIKKIEISYEYIDNLNIRFIKRKNLQALKDGLTEYCDQYRWTGDGAKMKVQDYNLIQDGMRNIFNVYRVNFNRALKKKEEIDVIVEWDLSDPNNIAGLFISSTIQEPTDSLVLKIKLPQNYKVRCVILEEKLGESAKKVINSKQDKINFDNTYVWEISKPKLSWCYELRWIKDDS